MKKGRRYTRNEVQLISQSLLGKTLSEYTNSELVSISAEGNKGGLGQLIEKYVFGIDNNSDSEPDFIEAGIELKVTPYKKLANNQLSAKERLVLNIIDYMTEYKNTFYTSHFWFKNNIIQLLWYLWEPDKDKKNYKITHEKLLELADSEDLYQIKEDWNTIINKIKEGKAHEISEADTMYLGACTKGANAESIRKQPFSKVGAMQRAFCFKTSYMTQLVRKYIGDYSDVEKLLSNSKLSFKEYLDSVVNNYIGKTATELKEMLNLNGKTKDDYSRIVNRMFNLKRGLAKSDEFQKANIIPKTIRIEANGNINESISFPSFKFKELIKQEWETSDLKEELETTKYMFFIFIKEKGEYVFKGYKLWNMPEQVIENEIHKFWDDTIKIIKNGVHFVVENNKVSNNLPGASHNGIMHVRPHANKSAYRLNNGFSKGNININGDQLPNGEWMTKQCFWFNKEYIKSILNHD